MSDQPSRPRTVAEARLLRELHFAACAQCGWVVRHPSTKKDFCADGKFLNGWVSALLIDRAIGPEPTA